MAIDIRDKVRCVRHARTAGRIDEAARLYSRLASERPRSLRVKMLGWLIAFDQRAVHVAANQLRAAIIQQPNSFDLQRTLVIALRKQGKYEEAAEWAEKAVSQRPENPEALTSLGACLLELGFYAKAAARLQQARDLKHDDAELETLLGMALQGEGRLKDAIAAFRRALDLNPGATNVWAMFSTALFLNMNPTEAAESARKVVEASPEDNIGHKLLAQALLADNLEAEAEREAVIAVEMDPGDAGAAALHASMLQVLGRMDESNRESYRSIELEPAQGLAYFNICRSRKITADDSALIDRMLELADANRLMPPEAELLYYALGKSLEDIRDYRRSMEFYDRANQTAYRNKFGEIPFDVVKHRLGFESVQNTFNASRISGWGGGDPSILPIVVVGMLRSGTTLTEQVLSCHPLVGGVGEQRFWPQNSSRAFHSEEGVLHDSVLGDLANEYCRRLESLSPGKDRVVDKMPSNYMHLGLIHMALPEARIIHVNRHPIDTCLSVYVTQNRIRIPWAHNKTNIALNYRRYQTLMDHWRQVLPSDRLLDVQYEELVSSPKTTVRRILDFCGLPWSEECLRPENNERGVMTPSLWQVRQPFYRTSVERWRKFEPWLGELSTCSNGSV